MLSPKYHFICENIKMAYQSQLPHILAKLFSKGFLYLNRAQKAALYRLGTFSTSAMVNPGIPGYHQYYAEHMLCATLCKACSLHVSDHMLIDASREPGAFPGPAASINCAIKSRPKSSSPSLIPIPINELIGYAANSAAPPPQTPTPTLQPLALT
jgi:hypothetical protein